MHCSAHSALRYEQAHWNICIVLNIYSMLKFCFEIQWCSSTAKMMNWAPCCSYHTKICWGRLITVHLIIHSYIIYFRTWSGYYICRRPILSLILYKFTVSSNTTHVCLSSTHVTAILNKNVIGKWPDGKRELDWSDKVWK